MSNSEQIESAATTLLPNDPPHKGYGKPGRSGPPANKNPQKHGLNTLKQAVKTLGSRVVDKRSKVGKALAAWRADLIADLGGAESISTQEAVDRRRGGQDEADPRQR